MSLPPHISALDVVVPSALMAAVEVAMREVTALDTAHAGRLDALGPLLLRTESVASSKIEDVRADVADYARALHGSRANTSATSMVAATSALDGLLRRINRTHRIELEALLEAHGLLMADDLLERQYAGRLRDMQNWIGGSDHSPRNARYVPPPPDTVRGYLDDLTAFLARDDLPSLIQAAIGHAQFESIHPFTDGNGRIGRALVNAVLRSRGATTGVVVPLASALVAHREGYFALLDDYRAGDPQSIISAFAAATRIAAVEARKTADRLAVMPGEWHERALRPRRGSAAHSILAVLPSRPVITAEEAHRIAGGPASSVYTALTRLHAADVLRPLTDRQRNQVWGVTDILAELDDLGGRIEAAARRDDTLMRTVRSS